MIKIFKKIKKLKSKPLLYTVVHFIIEMNWFNQTGKFKEGDLVKYNWKAKAYIRSVYDREKSIKKITKIITYKSGSESCEYTPIDKKGYSSGCDVFWIRKCYLWERPHNCI
jgi:hypothetical protein